MSRPLYETPGDRDRERQVVDAVFGPYGLRAEKMPRAYELDFAVLRGLQVMGMAEVKVRSRAYDTLMLSWHKALALREAARAGLIAWIVVALPEGIYTQRVGADDPIDLRWGGRTDRQDWQDMEPVAHFPMARMQRVMESPCWASTA